MKDFIDTLGIAGVCKDAQPIDLASFAESDAIYKYRETHDLFGLGVKKGESFTVRDITYKIELPLALVCPSAYVSSNVLSALLGLTPGDVRDILHFNKAIVFSKCKQKLVDFSTYIELVNDENENALIGDEAINKLLSELDARELSYSLGKEIFSAPDSRRSDLIERKQLVDEYISAHLSPESFFIRDIPILPREAEYYEALDLRLVGSDIGYLTYRVDVMRKRIERFSSPGTPLLITLNERRMLRQSLDALFGAYTESEIKFHDNIHSLRAILGGVYEGVVFGSDNVGAYISIPFRFKLGEENLRIYIKNRANGFVLTDNGFVIDHYKYVLGIKAEDNEEKIKQICERDSLSFDGVAFATEIPGFNNGLVLVQRFLGFLASLYLLSEIDLFAD